MPLLHKSIGPGLFASGVRRLPWYSPRVQCRAYADSKPTSSPDQAPGPKAGDSQLVRQESPTEAMAKHQPDYNVATDYRTSSVNLALPASTMMLANMYRSTFSPVPKRVMDGSEPGKSIAAAVLSGAPIDLQARTVR